MGKYKVVLLACLVAVASVLLIKTVGLQQVDEVKTLSSEMTSLKQAGFDNADSLTASLQQRNIELSEIRAQNAELKEEIDELEKNFLRELNRYPKYSRSEVLTIVSKIASDNGCDLKYFYILDAPEEKDTSSNDIEGQYSFRLTGSFDNIVKVLQSLNEETLQYSVGALTLKKDSSESFLSSPHDGISLFQWIEEVASAQNSSENSESSSSSTQQGTTSTPSGGTQLGPTVTQQPVIKLPELYTTTNYILDIAIKL